MIVLDTNAVIAILNGKPPSVRRRLVEALDVGEKVSISVVTLFELRYGAARSARPEENSKRIDDFLSGPIEVYAFDADDAAEAGRLRATLEAKGRPIGPFDLLIAAHALRLGASVVTANRREFERVDALTVIDWTV